MSALLGPPREAGRPIAAPPSSLQRTVQLTAQPVPRHRSPARLVTEHTIQTRSRPAVSTRDLVVVRPHRARQRVQRQLAASKPRPAPVAPPAPAVVPAQEAAPVSAVPAPPANGEDHSAHGHGRGHGHDDQDE